MPVSATGGRARAELRARLEARRPEIEEAALTRVRAIADPAEVSDPAYAEGLRRALPAAVRFGLETVDSTDGYGPPIPVDLFAQARLAARSGISLDTVLRRYLAGYSLIGFYLIEEAVKDGLMNGAELQRLTAGQAGRFDRLLAAVAEEHARESDAAAPAGGERRHAERIERMLAGEPVDVTGIAYDFEGWHVGLAGAGAGAEGTIRELAADLSCSFLCIPGGDRTTLAWLGSRRRLDPADLLRTLESGLDGSTPPGGRPPHTIALGEPAESISGWRLTHRQAVAALPVARHRPARAARYGDAALLAAVLQDDLAAVSLRRLYLAPLEQERDRGAELRRTLRAYFSTGRNVTSTAATLGVGRNTVTRRLAAIERRIGRTVDACAHDLEVALGMPDSR